MEFISHPHREAVRIFERHFGLIRGRSARDDLRLLLRHYSRIPYENLSKIIKVARYQELEEKFRLPLEVIQDHIEHRLGGTCFSLTYFLEQILRCWGYPCYKTMAHMAAGENIHCVIVAEVGGESCLVDPGYLLWEPLPLSRGGPQVLSAPQGRLELRYDGRGEEYHLFTCNARGRKWRYRFRPCPVSEEEFRRHWVASFSRPTLHDILLNRLTEQGLLYIRGHHLRLTSLAEERKENIRRDLHRQVERWFGIDPRWVEEALSVLERQRREWQQEKRGEALGGPSRAATG